MAVTTTMAATTPNRTPVAWTESTATWNTFGNNGIQTDGQEASSTASFFIPNSHETGMKRIDVTSDVLGWLNDPASNHGWVLINSSPTGDGWDFDESANQNEPEHVQTIPARTAAADTAPETDPGLEDGWDDFDDSF